MSSKIPSKWPPIVFSIVGAAFATLFIFFLALHLFGEGSLPNPTPLVVVTQAIPVPEPATPGLPIQLKIPKLKVAAAVEYVGLTPEGAMGVPKSPAGVAWYELGPRPGEIGSAAIAGHFGWKNGQPSVFDTLHTLRAGDTVLVEDGKGLTLTFVVRELRTYGMAKKVPSVFASSDGKAHLNLITCEGTWNEALQTYANRLVVFTDRKVE